MLTSGTLRCLLLAGTCLCVCGTPVHLLSTLPSAKHIDCNGDCDRSVETVTSTRAAGEDVKSKASDADYVNGLVLNVDAAGGARPEGIAAAVEAENRDSLDGRSRPTEAGVEDGSPRTKGKKVRSTSERRDADRRSVQPERSEHRRSVTGTEQLDMDVTRSSAAPRQQNDGTRIPGESDSFQEEDAETNLPSVVEPSTDIQMLTSQGPVPTAVFVSPVTSTPLTIWGRDGATISSLSGPLLPEFGPNLMPRDDGLDSLWTEAATPDGVDTVDPLSQDEATEGTMSSEALPLIFEPFEDVAPEEAPAAAAGFTPASEFGGAPESEVDPDQLVTEETNGDGPSLAPPLLMPDWMSPWQTSGAELQEPMTSLFPSVSQQQPGTEPGDRSERVAVRTPNLEKHLPTTGPSLSSLIQDTMTTVTMVTHHHPVHKSRSGLEEMESEEEDDEDENSEESVEDESEEEQTDSPKSPSTPPPYSLIPPPPVWVQRNQGLMRSWVELIREKAGYVSGMLAPVGIGITGALLIVGALYSIRMIHRKRRNSFKHQRRKVRQPEQPGEPCPSQQDQAMLLADSSEDEF